MTTHSGTTCLNQRNQCGRDRLEFYSEEGAVDVIMNCIILFSLLFSLL